MSTKIHTTVTPRNPHGIDGGDMAQIDTADEDNKRHADCQYTRFRGVQHDVKQVVRLQEQVGIVAYRRE